MKPENERGVLRLEGPDCHGCSIYDGRKQNSSSENNLSDNSERFERVARLLERDTVDFFDSQHVAVFGVGGVGSFAAESLARTGVGKVSMIDFDVVTESNINRQLPALGDTVGRFKVDVLVERFAQINPNATFVGHRTMFHAPTADRLLEGVDFVVDAIDNVSAKAYLIATCLERGIPVVACMGAGGKLLPSRVCVADLAKTHSDRLARALRRMLRADYDMDTTRHTGVYAVFSSEGRKGPFPQPGDKEGSISPQGTVSCVTGTFGLTAASVVIQLMLRKKESLSC